MQYNGNSDGQDIVSLVGDQTGLNTVVEIKQITRAANRANKIIWSWIFESYGGWQFHDDNLSKLPFATTTITANKDKYVLPPEAKTIKSIEVQNEAGTWNKLIAVSFAEINKRFSESEFEKGSSMPRYYSPVGEVIKLRPSPNFTKAAALRIQFDQGSVSFNSTDIEKDPGFCSDFHEAVADGASYFIGINKTLCNFNGIKDNWMQWEKKIKSYYAQRFEEKYPSTIKKGDYTNNII